MRLGIVWILALVCACVRPACSAEGELAPLPPGARAMTGRIATVLSLALSSDGKRAAVTADDGALRIFDTETCKPIQSFEAVDASAYRVCFSRDGTKLFLACDN